MRRFCGSILASEPTSERTKSAGAHLADEVRFRIAPEAASRQTGLEARRNSIRNVATVSGCQRMLS